MTRPEHRVNARPPAPPDSRVDKLVRLLNERVELANMNPWPPGDRPIWLVITETGTAEGVWTQSEVVASWLAFWLGLRSWLRREPSRIITARLDP